MVMKRLLHEAVTEGDAFSIDTGRGKRYVAEPGNFDSIPDIEAGMALTLAESRRE